ncbi:MAG: RNA pseudouridine synthase [Candidatus Colwellbacteria bacterium]|nr:RNA pseudouridine synthase [Candidatus Colwellbacteria bacterium]
MFDDNDKKIKVLYEDNHLIAVYKPAGIPAQKGGRGISLDVMVKDYLKSKYKKPGNVFLGLVHRIDQPVSGAMLFAKTSKGASRISEQFRDREIGKKYRAILIGKFKEKKGLLKSKMIKMDRGGYHKAEVVPFGSSSDNSKEATLEYRVIKESAKNSLVEIKLGTGRFHQIRAQFASLGHPVLGDTKYGSLIILPEGKIALHSSGITFKSATGDKDIEVVAPEPEYFKEIL